MYNYKFIFRSILVITFVLLIISPGCTFWAKANYREFGRQGFDELKKIKDIPEEYGSSIGNLNENNVGQYMALLSIIEERIKNANESFDIMEGYAITKDEKELASSLVNYTDYMAIGMGKFREMLEVLNRYNGWNISNPDPYAVSEAQKIKTEIETYFDLSNLELKKAQVILDRMPEYQKDFDYLYEIGGSQNTYQALESNENTNSIILFLIVFVAIILPLTFGFYVSYKRNLNRDNKIALTMGLILTYIIYLISYYIINLPQLVLIVIMIYIFSFPLVKAKNITQKEKIILVAFSPIAVIFLYVGALFLSLFLSSPSGADIFGIIIIILFLLTGILYCIVYLGSLLFKAKKKKENTVSGQILKINQNKMEASLEYLKSFDKLSEKEIVAFLYLRNNPENSRGKLIEMFGEETINSLIAKGHFIEDDIKN